MRLTFWIVLEIVTVVAVLVYSYMWKGPPGKRMDPKKLARYRLAVRLGVGWAVLILVRLVTHTYK